MENQAEIDTGARELDPRIAALRGWNPPCSNCRLPNKRPRGRYCHACHRAYMKGLRAKKRRDHL